MERPYIVCHMLTSLDGKIVGDYLEDERSTYYTDQYERIHESYGSQAWMCGRITFEEHYTLGHQLDLNQTDMPSVPRTDYVADKDARRFAVAVDPSGKLGWTKNFIVDKSKDRMGNHIVEVLTEQVSDAYLAYLRDLGISYIFGGEKQLDFNVVVKKLKLLFSIDQLLVEGGGVINGSFLNEGLIDELSLIIAPMADGTSNGLTLFETSSHLKKQPLVHFFLKDIEKLDDGGLWLKYVTKNI